MVNILGIESSCDDTGVAIVGQNGKILSNCIHSQLKQHLDNGGIIPMLAKEYHLANIDQVARRAFDESGLSSVGQDIDAIAVSTRPGLKLSLEVGLNYARTLAKKYSKPLIPIHHMQAHALMPLLQNPSIRFPFMVLLDDAPGDLLDKVGRRFKLKNLGPPYDQTSGGASIELLSRMPGADKYKYFDKSTSVPMLWSTDCNFSFTGYRGTYETFVDYFDNLWLSADRQTVMAELSHLSASLQRAMLVQMVKKLHRALFYYRMKWRYENEDAFAKTPTDEHVGFKIAKLNDEERDIDIVISGGVAANKYFVDNIRLACETQISTNSRVFSPSKELCSDNGLMIAWNGALRYRDYMARQPSHSNAGSRLEDSVLLGDQMDSIEVQSTSPIGSDISSRVRLVNLKLPKLEHPDLKTHRGSPREKQ